MTQQTAPRSANFPRQGEVPETQAGRNFTVAYVGKPEELRKYGVAHPARNRPFWGKVFLHEVLGLTGMEISFGVMPANASMPFYHKHQQNEEVYLFLNGSGQFQIDGQVVEVREGTAIRVSPDGVRCWRNTSSEDLFYVVIQAKAGSLEQWTGTDGIGIPDAVTWPA